MDLSESTAMVALPRAQPVLTLSPHPLLPAKDRQYVYAEFLPRETIAEYLERNHLARRFGLRDRRPVICTINGLRVPRNMWPHVRPKTGTFIHLQAVVMGGNGKNPLRTIAMLGLAVFAPYLGGVLAGMAGVTGTLAVGLFTGAVALAGGLLINAVFPLPKPPTQKVTQDSPTFSLAGGSNRMRPYEPLIKLAGKHKVFPDFGARVYQEFIGDDQFQFMVLNLGYNDAVLSEFRIGPTPIENYSGVEYEISGPDGKILLFPGNVDTVAGGELKQVAGFVQRTTSPDTTAIAVEISGALFSISDQGDMGAAGVVLEIQYRKVGDLAWINPIVEEDTVFGPRVSNVIKIVFQAFKQHILGGPLAPGQVRIQNSRRVPVRRTFQWNVDRGQYEVQVKRVTADDPDPKHVTSEIVWSQLRSYQPDDADYTGQLRLALRVKASGQLAGVLDQFNCIASARCQVWDGGAWVTAETSNPAFWLLDVARGKSVLGRRVWGGMLPDSRIDLENIKLFAEWCELKDLTFDYVFDSQLSVRDMLDMIALCGRGSISRSGGKLGAIWDAPDQPMEAVFSMANIVRDSFEIQYQSEELADEVVVSFVNQELDWQRDLVRAPVAGAVSPLRSREIHLPGCKFKSMAAEFANLYAAAQVLRAKRYRFRTDWDGMPCERGDVAAFSHDLASYDYSGRLMEGTTAAVLKLSCKVPLAGGGSFVTIVRPNGSFATYDVLGGAGDSDTLNLETPLAFDPGADPDHPPYDYRFQYGHTATPGKLVKIERWSPKGPDQVEIIAFDENPAYYAAEGNPILYLPPRPVFGTPEISNLNLIEDGVRVATGYLVECTLSWDAGSDYAYAEVFVAVDGGLLERRGETRGRSFAFTVHDGAGVYAEVIAYSSMNRLGKSAKVKLEQEISFAALFPPDDVTSFALDGNTFRWSKALHVDVMGSRIRYHFGINRSIADAHPLHDGLLPYSPKEFPELPAGTVTFMITHVDAAGRESDNPAVIVKDLGDPEIENVVEEYDYRAASWPGALTGASEIGGDIEADDLTDFYGPDNGPFYADDFGDFYEDSVYDTVVYMTDPVVFPYAWLGSRMVLEHEIEGLSYVIEYRRTSDEDLFYGTDEDAFYADDAEDFYPPPSAWLAWPGAITFESGEYQFRVTIDGSPVQGAIRALRLVIDVDDIDEFLPGVAIAPGGTRLPITKPFAVIKTIKLTLQDDGSTAVDAKIVDKEVVPGPLVICRDGALASVAGNVDAHIRGR